MDVLTAIAEIRKRLDEIEELAKHLPATGIASLLDARYPTHVVTKQMRDWMDMNGIVKKDRVRKGLLRVAKLADDGLTLDQIMVHRLVKQKTAMHEFIEDFYRKWSSR